MEALVAKLLDAYRVVINAGSDAGVRVGMSFVIYEWGDEVTDPATGKSLGQLEVFKGRGEIVHVQQSMSILKSIGDPFLHSKSMAALIMEATQPIAAEISKTAQNVKIGDRVKLLPGLH